MPHYDYDKDYPFAAFITNLGKYNEGALVGEWVQFPTTAEELKKAFERIGIGAKDDFGQTYEEWFITDYDCYVDGLYDLSGEYANLDELNYLASKLDDMSQDEYERFQAAMEIGDHTGSIQELINLTENLDCYDIYIYVRRTLGRLQKVDEKGHLVKKEKGTPSTEIVVRSPKSELSMRKIPLFDELWNDLMAYKEKQNALKDALGSEYQDQGYIFATPLGHHNDPKVYQTLFKRIVADAGIESANFHALRHTFATRALESGMDIKVLSALLGHAQASTTLNLYGHVLPDHKKISMEKMRGNYMSCSSIRGSSDDTSADVPQTQDPIISTMEDAQHNQEPAISIAAEDIQGLELSGDTNTAMPQIHDSTADTNANEEQAQAS